MTCRRLRSTNCQTNTLGRVWIPSAWKMRLWSKPLYYQGIFVGFWKSWYNPGKNGYFPVISLVCLGIIFTKGLSGSNLESYPRFSAEEWWRREKERPFCAGNCAAWQCWHMTINTSRRLGCWWENLPWGKWKGSGAKRYKPQARCSVLLYCAPYNRFGIIKEIIF